MTKRYRQPQRGVVLVIVLWMLVLMAVIAATITTIQQAEVRLAGSQVSRAEGRAFARAGIHYAVFRLLQTDPREAWLADGVPHTWEHRGNGFTITVTDERGRIDINAASPELLRRLLVAAGLEAGQSESIAAAIVDWRDPDNLRRPGGAEDDAYFGSGLAYGAKDERFADVSELRLVKGLNEYAYSLIREGVTVESGRASPNPEYAPTIVRTALANRTRENGVEGNAPPVATLSQASGRLDGVYRIRCEVALGSGDLFSAEAIIRPDQKAPAGFSISRWREGGRN